MQQLVAICILQALCILLRCKQLNEKELRCWCSYSKDKACAKQASYITNRVRSKLLIQRCANAPYAASKQAAISCIPLELHHASASLINISITPEVLCVSIRITHSVILCIHNTIVLCILIRHYMSYYIRMLFLRIACYYRRVLRTLLI